VGFFGGLDVDGWEELLWEGGREGGRAGGSVIVTSRRGREGGREGGKATYLLNKIRAGGIADQAYPSLHSSSEGVLDHFAGVSIDAPDGPFFHLLADDLGREGGREGRREGEGVLDHFAGV